MTQRRRITIEEILRSETKLSDVRTVWRLLLAEVPQPRRAAATIVGLTLGEVATQVSVALVGRNILAAATGSIGGAEPRVDFAQVWLALGLIALSFVFVRWRQVAQERIVLACRERGVQRLTHNIHRADYEDLSAVPMAALREIIMTDVAFAYQFLVESLAQTVVLGFWLLASVVILLWLAPPLLALMVLLGATFAAGILAALRRHMRLTGQKFVRLADLSQRAREVVEVDRIVLSRQFGIGAFFVRRFMQAHAAFVEISLAQARINATVSSAILMLNAVAFIAIICVGGWLIVAGQIEIGSLIAILFVLGQLLAAVAQMGDYAARAAETATGGKRLRAYWNVPPDPRLVQQADPAVRNGGVPPPLSEAHVTGHPTSPPQRSFVENLTGEAPSPQRRGGLGERSDASCDKPLLDAAPPQQSTTRPPAPARLRQITARGLAFRYEGGPFILHDTDLTLERGELAALTAETGAGKSTLALLLAGILQPTDGCVYLNGNPSWQPMLLDAGRVLYVGNRPILIEGSVRDNLFLNGAGTSDPDNQAPPRQRPHQMGVEQTDAELARFFAGITRAGQPFPIAEPIIGPNGTGVSSGQGQLIQLARAVLREPDFVIFDEATSALDMETEAAIQEELLPWCRDRICLVISHRRCPWTEQAAVRLKL